MIPTIHEILFLRLAPPGQRAVIQLIERRAQLRDIHRRGDLLLRHVEDQLAIDLRCRNPVVAWPGVEEHAAGLFRDAVPHREDVPPADGEKLAGAGGPGDDAASDLDQPARGLVDPRAAQTVGLDTFRDPDPIRALSAGRVAPVLCRRRRNILPC